MRHPEQQATKEEVVAQSKNRILRRIVALTLLLSLAGVACRDRQQGADRLEEDSSAAQQFDDDLTFNNITLDQSDEKGQRVWSVRSEQAIYSPDKKIANVKNPTGELYQDGKVIYQIQAQSGEVQQDGKRIVLRGKVVATDKKSGAILRGEELEWQPEQDSLLVRRDLTFTHPQVKGTADQMRLLNRQRRMELSGNVVALTTDPKMRMQGQRVVWRIDDQQLVSDQPVQIQRFQGEKATDQATGNQATVNLKTKTMQLKQNARVAAVEPPIVVAGNSLLWNMGQEVLTADQPVTVQHRQQRITVNANQGRFDMKREVVYLSQNVRIVGQRNQSRLNANNLTWTVPTQQVVAEGNVTYAQQDPPFNLRGERAVGRLENETIVVSGGGSPVVTEIVPEGLNLN